jgi:ligand-binding sensor domain-containing protein/signal transduction histidine kinase
VVWLLVTSALAVWGQEYYSQNWHLDEGLPDGDIAAIEQTPDGFLWIGTPKGLARFDGLQFKVFVPENTPAFTDRRIASLMTDRAGALWVGTLDGNLLRRESGRFESMRPPLLAVSSSEKKPKSGSWLWDRRTRSIQATGETNSSPEPGFAQVRADLIQDEGGAVWWYVSSQGLMRLKDGQWTVFSTTNGPPSGEIEQLGCGPEGHVWLAAQGRLYRFHSDRWDLADKAVPLTGRGPVLARARQAGLWVAEPQESWFKGGGTVRRLAGGKWQEILPPIAPTPLANRSVITCLLEDHNGQVWYGTSAGGLFHCDRGGQWQRLNARGSVSQGCITCLFEDRQGNLWVGALGDGLYQIRRQPVTMLSLPSPLENFEINTIWASRSGTIWIGTGGAAVARLQDRNRVTVYGVAEGLENPHVCALFEDSRTNIWAGTARGLFRFDGDRFLPVAGPPEMNGWVKALFEDRAGRLWIGTLGGLISYEQGKFVTHPWSADARQAQGQNLDIRAIAEDSAGNLWVGTIGQGLFRLAPGQAAQRIGAYPASDARALYFDKGGTLWIGSWGNGLVRMRGAQFKVFTLADGLPCEKIQSILPGPGDTLWLSSDNGLVGIEQRVFDHYEAGQSPPLPCWRISVAQGLGNRCCSGSGQPVSTRSPDGKLWFPDYEAAAILDPRHVPTSRITPSVVVESILADGKELSPAKAGSFQAPSSVRRYEFSYVAPDLTRPHELSFRYKLEGLDHAWVDAGAQRVVSYSRLPHGQYQFRAAVGGSDGRWYESQPLQLRVVPYFWELRWVQVLAIVLLVAGIGGRIALYERHRLRRQVERLEAQQALENERRRIARDLHDELGARLTSIAINGELTVQQNQLPATTKSEVRALVGDVRRLISTTDEIIWTTDPENDTLTNLATYLGDYVERTLTTSGVAYRLDVAPDLPDLPVAAQSRHNLLLAVKETMNNALRHASPKMIRLAVAGQDGRLTVTIADDGRGFDPAAPPRRGKGLNNIRSRMELIQGRAEITSATGQGTTVILSMPLFTGYSHT